MRAETKSQPEPLGKIAETRPKAGYPNVKPFWVKAGEWGPDTLSAKQVAEVLLENPEKEYVDGYTVRCKKCGKLRGKLIWSEPPDSERWLVIPMHYNHLDADPKVRTQQCQCDLFREETRRKQDEDLFRQSEVDRNRRESNLPRRYETTDFSEIPDDTPGKHTAQAFCKAAREDLRRGLGLWIQTAPKTDSAALCAAITNALLNQGFRVFTISPVRFARRIEENRKKLVSSEDLFEQVRHCQFLVVDEFDSNEFSEPLRKSEWALKLFLQELGRRYDAMFPTVFCSPDTPDDLLTLHPSSERLFRKATAFVRNKNGRVIALPEAKPENHLPESSGRMIPDSAPEPNSGEEE